jgi:glycosyltransferase involved in cell wall biosynthesis
MSIPGTAGAVRAPLRVLVIVSNAIVGGMETCVLRLAERLSPAEFELHVLAPFASPFTERIAPWVASVHHAPMGEPMPWHTLQLAVGLVRRARIDLIHSHLWTGHALAALVGRVTATPVLATVHSMHVSMLDLEAHRLGGTHLCVVSEAAHAHALAIGIAPERITRIYNGVDVDVFVPRGAAATPAHADTAGPAGVVDDALAPAAARLGIAPGGCVTIGYVGRFSVEKNPQLFVRAAARVRRQVPDARFVMVGDGPLRADLEVQAQRLGVSDVLAFAGERDDMPAVYPLLDVLALTSWHEGTPLVLLEAMACAVPVVATSVGGVPELVCVGATGTLVPEGDEGPLGDALVTLARDPALRARYGMAARQRAVPSTTSYHRVENPASGKVKKDPLLNDRGIGISSGMIRNSRVAAHHASSSATRIRSPMVGYGDSNGSMVSSAAIDRSRGSARTARRAPASGSAG